MDEAPLRFSLWNISGRKALWYDGQRLVLDIVLDKRAARMIVASALSEGSPFGYFIPAGSDALQYKSQLESAMAIVHAPSTERSVSRSRPSRAALIHMRALQVLDALSASASQREIAVVLFGSTRVVRSWTPDGDLRAHVRYLIRRSREFMQGGYRTLTRTLYEH